MNSPPHIVPFGKFDGIGGAPHDTFPNLRYDTPEQMSGDKNVLTVLLGNKVRFKFLM